MLEPVVRGDLPWIDMTGAFFLTRVMNCRQESSRNVHNPGVIRLAPLIAVLSVFAANAPAAIVFWTGGIATADFDVPGQQSFKIGSLNASNGGSYVLNNGSVPEFRIEFDGVNPENPRMVNTNFVPIAVSNELSGEGLRQFALNEVIGPSVSIDWAGQGFMEQVSGTTIWDTNTQGYAGFRVDVGGGNYNYGWALLDYDDAGNAVELIAFAMESEVNTSIQAGAVPEPGVVTLGLAALFGTVLRRRRAA